MSVKSVLNINSSINSLVLFKPRLTSWSNSAFSLFQIVSSVQLARVIILSICFSNSVILISISFHQFIVLASSNLGSKSSLSDSVYFFPELFPFRMFDFQLIWYFSEFQFNCFFRQYVCYKLVNCHSVSQIGYNVTCMKRSV